jgi:hypothetical protein
VLDSLPRVKSNHDVKVIWGPVYGIAVGMPGIRPSCKDAELRKTPFKPDDDISSAAILAGKTSNDCELKVDHHSTESVTPQSGSGSGSSTILLRSRARRLSDASPPPPSVASLSDSCTKTERKVRVCSHGLGGSDRA